MIIDTFLSMAIAASEFARRHFLSSRRALLRTHRDSIAARREQVRNVFNVSVCVFDRLADLEHRRARRLVHESGCAYARIPVVIGEVVKRACGQCGTTPRNRLEGNRNSELTTSRLTGTRGDDPRFLVGWCAD